MEKDGEVRKVPCAVYSRVVGYITPVSLWNDGKKQEWKDRLPYILKGHRATPEKEDAQPSPA